VSNAISAVDFDRFAADMRQCSIFSIEFLARRDHFGKLRTQRLRVAAYKKIPIAEHAPIIHRLYGFDVHYATSRTLIFSTFLFMGIRLV